MAPDRVRLPLRFDVAALQADLAAMEEGEWIGHFVTRNYEGNWGAVALRMQASAAGMHPIMSIVSQPDCADWVDTPLLENSPAFRTALATFQCPLESARLMRLTAGSVIKEHCDPQLALESGFARVHVPIHTNPEVEFCLNDRRVIMGEGECWYLRLSDPHRVANRGSADRIHLVVDLVVNDWFRSLFETAVSADAP